MPVSESHIRDLAKALAEGRLVLFVGAGLSYQSRRLDGKSDRLPLWRELAAMAAEEFDEKPEDYNFNITDMFDAIVSRRSRTELEKFIRYTLDDTPFDVHRVHSLLSELPWARVYTTNYDSLLVRALGSNKPIVLEKDFDLLSSSGEQASQVIHLHGNLDDPHTLTGEDYEIWEEKHPQATAQLTSDGIQKSFLFLGYSFSDPHFKLGLLARLKRLKHGRQHRNYAWMWSVPERQAALLNSRDKIDVQSLTDDAEWETALLALQSAFRDEEKGKRN
ncbi:MAG: SIR2 family protein, partial [Rhizobiaceae bacterium]|nr:SIR2 family protein [Rhizobiaceae bacterium]